MTRRILGYGSLLSEPSLRRSVPGAKNLVLARLEGYRRSFDLEASHTYDKATGAPIAVLNLRPSPHDHLEGLLFDCPSRSWDALRHREEGYQCIEVEVCTLNGETEAVLTFLEAAAPVYPFLESSEQQRAYLALCQAGAAAWGAGFLQRFQESTWIAQKRLSELAQRDA